MDIKLVVNSASKLFTLPEICTKLHEIIYDPSSSAADIAKLITIDPSLSARLLKIANSSFYNFPSQIDDLKRAINLIGTEDLYNLALATSTPETFASLEKNEHIDMGHYWRHSVITGLIAKTLGKSCGIRHGERLFLSGLFHNIGQLVVLEQLPEQFIEIETLKKADTAPWVIEKQVLGYSYAEVSTELLRCWKMPDHIIEMVYSQHNPEKSADPITASLLHIATRSASQLAHGQDDGFDFRQAILPVAWESTTLEEEQVQQAINIAETDCSTIISAMSGKKV